MSAIFGIFNRRGEPVTRDALLAGMKGVDFYVRDSQAVWVDGQVGFGHMMLRITPESASETLPLTVNELTITADARLDYRDDLFAALGVGNAERAEMPDSVLILRAYEKWGEDCPKYLVGDYAFAIWDARQQTLFSARDHVGTKPFFYFESSEFFAFASDLRALVAFEMVEPRLEETEIARYLLGPSGSYIQNAHTFFKDIYRLPFGHRLTVGGTSKQMERYWLPSDQPALRLPTLDDYADRLLELLEGAVAERLRTDYPVGTHLSGGIDSSSLAVIAARALRQRGRTLYPFSWSAPPGEDADVTEHHRIEAVCRQEGLTANYSQLTLDTWRRIADVDTALVPIVTMTLEADTQAQAAALGIRVMISGWGGDETASFNGRGMPADWLRRGQWRQVARFLQLRDMLRHPRRWRSVLERFWRGLVMPFLPAPLYERVRQKQGESFINPEFAARVGLAVRPTAPPRILPGAFANQSSYYLYGHLTARAESWAIAGMEHGLVYVYPLLDRRLMEFLFTLPGEIYANNGARERYFYRYTMSRILPDVVAWGDVKDDRTFRVSSTPLSVQDADIEHQRLLADPRLSMPHPWIDTARLREHICDPTRFRKGGDLFRVAQALECLDIWDRWHSS